MLFHAKLKLKSKRKKITIKRAIIIILSLILMGIVYSFGIAVAENIQVDQAIYQFKERAVFEEEVNFEYQSGVFQTRKYYKVSRETSYELNDERSVFYNDTRKFLGQKGDIFLSQHSPFPYNPLIHLFVSYNFGGHAAINNGNNRFIEAVGFPDDDESLWDIITHPGNEPHNYSVTISQSSSNYWLNPVYRSTASKEYPYYGTKYRNEFIGLRVKNVTNDQIDGAVDYASNLVDKNLYNFLFFLNMEYKYYCTDLVSRAYQSVMVPESKQRLYSKSLNDDRFITSVNDIVLSEDTYMTFYVEVIDDVWHIYYLEDMVG